MTPKQAINFYETQTALAAAMEVSQPCVSNWLKRGVIPPFQQLRLQAISGGALQAAKSVTRRVSQP